MSSLQGLEGTVGFRIPDLLATQVQVFCFFELMFVPLISSHLIPSQRPTYTIHLTHSSILSPFSPTMRKHMTTSHDYVQTLKGQKLRFPDLDGLVQGWPQGLNPNYDAVKKIHHENIKGYVAVNDMVEKPNQTIYHKTGLT